MMKLLRIAALVLLIISLMSACSYAGQYDIEARTEIFVDNDESRSYTFDQVFHFKDETSKIGLGATQTLIDETGRTRSYCGGLIEGYKNFGAVDVAGKMKLVSWNGRFRAPLSLYSSQSLGRFRFEENFEYGTIDSVKAFDAHIDFTSAGGSVDYSILDALTITGGYWHRWSSDENSRSLYLGRLIYDFNDTCHVQYRYRCIRNKEKVPEYYSPETFDQHTVLFGYFDSFFDRIRLRAWVGPVFQDDGFESDIGMLEDVRVICKITEAWALEGRIEANQVGSGYQYIYSTLAVSYDF